MPFLGLPACVLRLDIQKLSLSRLYHAVIYLRDSIRKPLRTRTRTSIRILLKSVTSEIGNVAQRHCIWWQNSSEQCLSSRGCKTISIH